MSKADGRNHPMRFTSVSSQLALGTPSLPPQAGVAGKLPGLPNESLTALQVCGAISIAQNLRDN